MRFFLSKALFICMLFHGFVTNAQTQNRNDFELFYEKFGVKGSFVLLNENDEQFTIYNRSQIDQAFTPASTFKICNSLIGLETGVIQDENFVIPWDSVVRSVANWNQSQDMKTAFKNSTVWYYQSLARQVGGEKMKYWLDKIGYGNADTSGGIDQFWLTGGLRITPMQQINFLKRLYNNDLPFSQHTMSLLKNIMIVKETSEYTLYAKTGWGQSGATDIGWYIGFLETKDNVYYFVNCIQNTVVKNENFEKARKEIVFEILNELKICEIKK